MDAAQQALWQQADQTLDALLDLPQDQRHAALQTMHLPEAVHVNVLRLLQAHQTGGVLDVGLQVPELSPPPLDLSGRVLGRWRLQQRIGEGGMAVVYRALSITPPVDQVAAVKILALGSLARDAQGDGLLREQALLARLQHPFIAPFHDAGVSEDGTPWLAMGLVEGERIDHWCERHAADIGTRIGLVLEVADALSYAHRNLVVHRDIKPSNVLVDGDGHVRLLDFGIGHLLDHATERTATLLRALTPEYAAPEQFSGKAASTAVDVYGLGALLYRLLVGHPPEMAGLSSTVTQSPSRRVARDTSQHAVTRRAHASALRGDLDTIVMKALALDAKDRYVSIDALADDLRRWLTRRPITARGPSLRYRLRMFVRRNGVAVAGGAAVLVALAAGLAGTAWQAQRATEHAKLAEAAAQRSQAQLSYLDGILDDLVAPSTSTAQKRDTAELIRVAADRARKELVGQEAVLASVEASLSSVAERAGQMVLATELAEAALSRQQKLAGADESPKAMAMIAVARLARLADPPAVDKAQRLADQALALLQSKGVGSSAMVVALTERALQHVDQDQVEKADALFLQAENTCKQLAEDDLACEQMLLTRGSSLYRIARYEQADALLRKLVEARKRRVGEDHVLSFNAQQLLALNTLRAGKPKLAEPMLEQLLTLQRAAYAQPTRETLQTLQGLAEAKLANSDMPAALDLAQQVMEETRIVAGESSPELAMAYSQLGNVTFADGAYVAAANAYHDARERYRVLYGEDSTAFNIVTGNLADALRESGDMQRALSLQREALRSSELSAATQPMRVAPRLSNFARTLVMAGRAEEALPLYEKAIALYQQHMPEGHHHHVVSAYYGAALDAAGRGEQARQTLGAARSALRAAVGEAHRFSWEALALDVSAQCTAPPSTSCADVAGDARAALKHPALPGRARQMLQQALAGHRSR